MTAPEASPVVRELAELRRGRGLDATDLHARVGPRLRVICDIGPLDTPATVRRKLILRLTDLCGRLPRDLRLAALVALGLHEEASGEFLDRRIAWLASCFDRDPRTARRRIDAAFRLLGEYLDEAGSDDVTSPYAPSGWYVESMRAVLRLDVDPPILSEERCIVCTVDELDEVIVAVSAPRDPAADVRAVSAEVIYGGELVECRRVSASHTRFVVRLARPLGLGQRHEYGIQFVGYPRSMLRPYYVLTPMTRCEHFSVRVRFGGSDRPADIWRLDGVPARVVDDFMPSGERLSIDNVGDVALEFHTLQQGLSYGLQWSGSSDDRFDSP